MHAVVVRLTINDLEADLDTLRSQIVPRVSQSPGFITGFWTRKDHTGLSMIIFDSEAAANAATGRVQVGTADVASLDDVEVREVVAHA